MDLSSLNSRFLFLFTITILVLSSTFVSATENSRKSTRRKLTIKLYNTSDLAYVKAKGPNDTLHYLFSGQNEMTILCIKTKPKGELDINLTSPIPQITVKPKDSFLYSFAVIFTTLIEYDDPKDTATLTDYDPDTWKMHKTSVKLTTAKDKDIVFAKNITIRNVTGTVSFSLKNFVDDSRQDRLPHLIVISDSSLLDFVVDKVNPSFNHSRFALSTTYISYGNKSTFSINSEKSLDDEYTPGTFEVSNWVAVGSEHSFLQWKPVSYFDNDRKTQTSTFVKTYTMATNLNGTLPWNDSFAYQYFMTTSNFNMISNYISFGRSEDKFYSRNRYTSWSATIGYGVPPAEAVSTMAIVIISVGLGIPVLVFIGGGIFLCIRKRRSGYQQFYGTISS